MFWLLTLPFRIVFGILFGLLALPFAILALPFALLALPFLLLRFVIKAVVTVALLPIVLFVAVVGAIVGFFALSLAIMVPLLPFAFLAFCVWAIVRMASPARLRTI